MYLTNNSEKFFLVDIVFAKFGLGFNGNCLIFFLIVTDFGEAFYGGSRNPIFEKNRISGSIKFFKTLKKSDF
jgi:hypothetical protein